MSGAGGYRVLSSHSGEEYERGDTYRAQGLNEPQLGVEPEPAGDSEPLQQQAAALAASRGRQAGVLP